MEKELFLGNEGDYSAAALPILRGSCSRQEDCCGFPCLVCNPGALPGVGLLERGLERQSKGRKKNGTARERKKRATCGEKEVKFPPFVYDTILYRDDRKMSPKTLRTSKQIQPCNKMHTLRHMRAALLT